ELVKFLVSNKGESEFAKLDYFIPGSIPEIAKQWYGQKPPDHRGKALDAALADSAKVADTYFDSAKIQSAYVPALQKAWFDGAPVDAQVKEAAKAMNQALAQSWQKFQTG